MWREWMADNGQELAPAQSQMMLDDRHFQLSSTINGLGVSLFVDWLVRDELRNGLLVNPFGRAFSTTFAYHVITPKDVVLSPRAAGVRDWLLSLATEKEGAGAARRSSRGTASTR
jgi:LysR family glycine cleavage system transcriptional activator